MSKEERDQQIADLYLAGRSASELARAFALSIPTIRAILAARGAKRPDAGQVEKEQRTRPPRKSLTPTHEKLGERLSSHRALMLKQTRREASERLGWSVHKVAAVEDGKFDLTLNDLMDLTNYTKTPINELVKL